MAQHRERLRDIMKMNAQIKRQIDALQRCREDRSILVAWAAAELSEGQASKALGLDRVAARKLMDEAMAEGLKAVEDRRKVQGPVLPQKA